MKFVETVKEKTKSTCEKVKSKVKTAAIKTVDYLDQNQEMIKPVIYGSIAVVGGVVTGIMNYATGGQPAKDACLVEDDVTGLKFNTKHPLTNNEILELGDRMIDGQTKGEALQDMSLLKKEKRRRYSGK